MNRIKNIDFLRILFALLIAFHHFTNTGAIKNSADIFVRSLPQNTFNLPFIVDFFFIISGFFLIISWKKQPTIAFVKNKFSRLFPLMLLYLALIRLWKFLGITDYSFRESVFSLLLLDNVGLSIHNSGVAWFISAYFVTICFYYYLLKNFNSKNVQLAIFLLIYFSYAFLVHRQNGNISGTNMTYGYIFNVGMLRALAGIGIGYFIGLWYRQYNYIEDTPRQKIIYSILEACSLSYMIYFLLIRNPNLNSLLYVMTFCVLFTLFLLNKGIISQFFNNNISVICGRYALAVYMIHEPVLRITRPLIFDKYSQLVTDHIWYMTGVYITIVAVSAVIAYHFVEIPGTKMIKKLLFPKEESTATAGNLEREREREKLLCLALYKRCFAQKYFLR